MTALLVVALLLAGGAYLGHGPVDPPPAAPPSPRAQPGKPRRRNWRKTQKFSNTPWKHLRGAR